MKKRKRFLSVTMLAAVLVFCPAFSGCSEETAEISPIWVAVKSVGGDNGLFADGQDYSVTLCFGYTAAYVQDCKIAVITVTDTNNDTAKEESRTFVIDNFGDEKYHKHYKDASAATMEMSFPAPANQPCTGALEIELRCFEDEADYQMGEDYCGTGHCFVIYLAESEIGTIISSMSVDELWKRRCNILLAEGKLTLDEYNGDMHKLKEAACTGGLRRGISSEWTDNSSFRGEGGVHFIETVDDNGIANGTFSATTDNETVTLSYLTQMDSGWYNLCYGELYKPNTQIFYLTAETVSGVETWFITYHDGKLTLSGPVSGWSNGITFDYLIVTDSRNGGAETYYKLTDDMSLLEIEIDNP